MTFLFQRNNVSFISNDIPAELQGRLSGHWLLGLGCGITMLYLKDNPKRYDVADSRLGCECKHLLLLVCLKVSKCVPTMWEIKEHMGGK